MHDDLEIAQEIDWMDDKPNIEEKFGACHISDQMIHCVFFNPSSSVIFGATSLDTIGVKSPSKTINL